MNIPNLFRKILLTDIQLLVLTGVIQQIKIDIPVIVRKSLVADRTV